MLTNSESRSVDFATRNHRGSNPAKRRLVRDRSRAGGTKTRNHFTATTPDTLIALPDERATGELFEVVRGKRVLGTYTVKAQAEAIATQKRGYVQTAQSSPAIAPRTIPAPLPGPSPDQYTFEAIKVYWGIPSEEMIIKKDGTTRSKSVGMVMYKVHITCQRSGTRWTYTGTKRNEKLTWSDSRVKGKTMKQEEFEVEMNKYTHKPSVFDNMITMKLSTYRASYPGA